MNTIMLVSLNDVSKIEVRCPCCDQVSVYPVLVERKVSCTNPHCNDPHYGRFEEVERLLSILLVLKPEDMPQVSLRLED